jgi:hypothetical protein
MLCEAASHQAYGAGCYSIPGQTAYQYFADAAVASAAMQGNALMSLNTGSGYTLTWLPGGATGFSAPTGGATSVALSDDGSTTVTPSVPLTLAGGGSSPTVTISHNCIITVGSTANNSGDWTPSGAEDASAANRAFYSWHDYNNNEAGSGPIQWEELTIGPDQVLCVTWNGVESYPTTVVNPSTMQFQVNLTTGHVTALWPAIDTNTGSTFGSQHLVGYTSSTGADPGSVDLSLGPVVAANAVVPPTLSAAPAPVFTLGGSSVPMTWTANSMRDASPSAPGIYIGLLMFSLSPPLFGTGIDLALIGIDAPGCTLLVGSIDVSLGLTGFSPSIAQPITMPQPQNPGDTFYSQVANFIVPNSLPGGLNNFGVTLTNGVKSVFQLQ